MNDFLPEGYEIPKTPSRYTRLDDWTTKLRLLPSGLDRDTIIYYEYYDTRWEKPLPIRSFKPFDSTPWIKVWERVKEVWAMKVYNYNDKIVQVFSVPQKTIKEAIINLYEDEDYGSPLLYDLKIKRTGEKLDTKYSIIAWPLKDFEEPTDFKDVRIDWATYMESGTEVFLDINE